MCADDREGLGLAGLGVLLAGGYLGGHLSLVLNVNRTAWQGRPAGVNRGC